MPETIETMKTSIRLPQSLWRAAKIRAMDEGRELQDLIAEALEAYLKSAEKKGGRR